MQQHEENDHFDTAIGTSNIGDIVILESLETQLEELLKQCFVVRYATHLKNFNFLTYLRLRAKRRYADECDYKFIMGTNLLSYDIFNTRRQWQIGLLTWPLYKNVIVAGVGTTQGRRRLTAYSKWIYKRILSKNIYIPSETRKAGSFWNPSASVPSTPAAPPSGS